MKTLLLQKFASINCNRTSSIVYVVSIFLNFMKHAVNKCLFVCLLDKKFNSPDPTDRKEIFKRERSKVN